MLDYFVGSGYELIDSAVNYPINADPECFRLAATYLGEWLQSRKPQNAKVHYKVGSVDNSGGPETALAGSDLLLSAELARGVFGRYLHGIAVHWDNRDDPEAIAGSLSALRKLREEGLRIGFSGVQRPDLYYAGAPELADVWQIQVKENAATQEARRRYEAYFPNAAYFSYGINMGGVKSTKARPGNSLDLRGASEPAIAERLRDAIQNWTDVAPRPETLNHLALMIAWSKPGLSGIVLGPRNIDQLVDTLTFWERLDQEADATAVRERVNRLLEPGGSLE